MRRLIYKLKTVSKIILLNIIFLIAIICNINKSSFAAVYQYHPSSLLSLAKGIDPSNPYQLKLQCIDHDGFEDLDGNGAIKTFYTLTLIKSRKDLYELLNISTSLSARYKFFAGGNSSGSYSFEDEKIFHSDSLTWVIIASSDFGRRGLKNPRINQSAKEILQLSGIRNFEDRCGLEVVLEERRMASIALMFTVSNISESNKKNIEASFKSNVGVISSLSLANSSNYEKFYKYAEAIGKITIKFFAIGGRGLSDLAGLAVHDPYDLQAIQDALGFYMKGINKQTSASVEYITASYDIFNIVGMIKIPNLYQDFILSEYFFKYMQIESEIRRINNILNNENGSKPQPISLTESNELTTLYRERVDILFSLTKDAQKCNNDPLQCKLPDVNVKNIDWLKYEKNEQIDSNSSNDKFILCENGRKSALQANLINKREYDYFKDLNYGPVFQFANFQGTIVGWIECKEYTPY